MKTRTMKSANVWAEANELHFGKRIIDCAAKRLCLLEAQNLCARACKRAGLRDFGDPPVEGPLSMLVKSFEREANLHPLGRLLLRGHLVELLETRLRLTSAWRGREKELEAAGIQRPVFITGMPRSGSTFLHELLAQDPNHRSPMVWEVMFPIAAASANRRNAERSVRRAAARLWWFRRLVPQADSVHPIRALSPQECIAIHSYTFLSEEFVSFGRVPTYENYLHSGGVALAYAWQKRFLQHLQSGLPARRWILKTPDHLYALEELFSVFPDAVIVQLHRNPLEVLKSSIQLCGALHGLFVRQGGAHQLRDHEAKALAERNERSIRFRDLHPQYADRFLDLNYADLVSDPLKAVRRVYDHLDQPLTEPNALRMQRLISTRSRYAHRTKPTLEDLGIDEQTEISRFQKYCFRFGIPCM